MIPHSHSSRASRKTGRRFWPVAAAGVVTVAMTGGGVFFLTEQRLEQKLHNQQQALAAARAEEEAWRLRHQQAQAGLEAAHARQQSYEALTAAKATAEATLAALTTELEAAKAALLDVSRRRQEAVAQVRRHGAGLTLLELALADGRVLREVTVQRVTPEGIVFLHRAGHTTATWRELPMDMVERFHPDGPEARSFTLSSIDTEADPDHPVFGPEEPTPTP